MGSVRTYQPGDEIELAPRLRQADLNELHAASTLDPMNILRMGAELSVPSLTILDNHGTICGMFGVNPDGRVWLLGSDALVSGSLMRQFLRESRIYVQSFQALYPLLWNHIDERNTVHIRWLEHMGFTFISRIPAYGPFGLPFLEFVRI